MKKQRFLITLSAFLLTVASWAVPAKPGQWRMLFLADGRQIKAELKGDEFTHFWQTESGDCYISEGKAFHLIDKYTLSQQAQSIRMEREQLRSRRTAHTRGLGDNHAPYTGKKKGLIILVQFCDLSFKVTDPLTTFNHIANGKNYIEGNFKGSVHDYFLAQSGGLFELDFDVVGPVTLKNGYAYYGQDNGEKGLDKHPGEMVVEACKAVDAQVNFADYDWDGDHYADQVFIIYAGKGQADGGSDDTIWPHEFELEYAYGSKPVFDNITVNTYACGPEQNGKGNIDGIGTICHEFSHCLGLPDTYDLLHANNYGMGSWDLMCNGSYNGNGYLPPNYTAFEQAYIGWNDPIVLMEDQVVSGMKPIGDGGNIYQLVNDDYPNEYFLLENRQQTGWDEAIGGSGLLVTHIDFDLDVWHHNAVNSVGSTFMKGNNIFKTNHQYLSIVPADGITNHNDESSDTYPYNLKDSISNTSSPTFTLYHAKTNGSTLLGKAITDIRQNSDGSIDFKFRAVDTNTEAHIGGVVFHETFDQCNGEGGNDGNWRVSSGSAEYIADNKGWKLAGEGGGYKCARFGNVVTKGIVTTPKFCVTGNTKLTFRAAPYGEDEIEIGITVMGSNEVMLSQMSYTLLPEQWTECESLISGTGEIAIQFTPSKNRFFLDEVKAEVMSETSTIKTVWNNKADARIYDIHGRYAGTDIESLAKGIYILGGKKIIK